MKQSKKVASLLGIWLLTSSSTVHCTPAEPLQNSQQAVEFFTHELEFKTNPHGAKAVVEGKVKNVTIVDLRTANDFAKGHIPGAINIPWDQHKSFNGDETSFPELRKDGYNYVYCYELLCSLWVSV